MFHSLHTPIQFTSITALSIDTNNAHSYINASTILTTHWFTLPMWLILPNIILLTWVIAMSFREIWIMCFINQFNCKDPNLSLFFYSLQILHCNGVYQLLIFKIIRPQNIGINWAKCVCNGPLPPLNNHCQH